MLGKEPTGGSSMSKCVRWWSVRNNVAGVAVMVGWGYSSQVTMSHTCGEALTMTRDVPSLSLLHNHRDAVWEFEQDLRALCVSQGTGVRCFKPSAAVTAAASFRHRAHSLGAPGPTKELVGFDCTVGRKGGFRINAAAAAAACVIAHTCMRCKFHCCSRHLWRFCRHLV